MYGKVTIGKPLQPARGLLWGQMDSGKLIVQDPILGDGRILVSGWDTEVFTPATDRRHAGADDVHRHQHPFPRHRRQVPADLPRASGIDLTAIGAGVA